MTAKGLGPSPVCSTLAKSGNVFLRMAMAAETLADGWEPLSCMISASVSIASGVNFSHKARTSGSCLGRPPGLPLTPFGNGLPLPGILGCSFLASFNRLDIHLLLLEWRCFSVADHILSRADLYQSRIIEPNVAISAN